MIRMTALKRMSLLKELGKVGSNYDLMVIVTSLHALGGHLSLHALQMTAHALIPSSDLSITPGSDTTCIFLYLLRRAEYGSQEHACTLIENITMLCPPIMR